MSFSYNPNLPIPTDNPSQDVTGMQTNSISIKNWTEVDHVGFNNSISGQHTKVTLSQFTSSPPAQTNQSSLVYSAAGTALSTAPQLFYLNSQATFHLSPIRAWAFCNSSGIVSSQSSNISSFVKNSIGQYTITLSTTAVNSANFSVIASSTLDVGANFVTINSSTYGFSGGNGSFKLFCLNSLGNPADPTNFSFIILQI